MALKKNKTLRIILFAVFSFSALAVWSQVPAPDSSSIEQRVDSLFSKLTLEQKIDLIGGENEMFTCAIPSIGLPQLKMSDGPEGVRTWGPDTAYAGGVALAAAWDSALAERMGVSIARDARARGVHFLLGPGVNLYRAPMNGRNFEYFGEDPFLASRIAVGYIDGVQSQGVVATVKHFALNNQEWDRYDVSSDADERTMRELYLPAFEAAVREAHVGAVMNSYNLINGAYATQNYWLNVEVLKKEWGFQGVLMSDWGATHDGIAAANNGLDLEMPDAQFMNRKNLLSDIQAEQISVATIDDKVRRILRTAVRFGFLDRPQQDLSIPFYSQAARQVALDEARESIVLLKNDGNLLPLDAAKVHTIAVIGPDAWPAVTGGGGSSTVEPYAAVSILAGLTGNSAGVKVLYARGLPQIDEISNRTVFDKGVEIEVFDNADFSGIPTTTSDEHISNGGPETWWAPQAEKPQSVRYTARYTAKDSGPYLFLIAGAEGDAYKLRVDGRVAIEQTDHEGHAPHRATLNLNAGRPISLELDYKPFGPETKLNFGICSMDEVVSPEARRIASMADVALVSVGFDHVTEGEGFDRTFELPWGQDVLIQAIRAVNPKTVVTVTGGGDVDSRRWIGYVPALLQLWYPGQEGGTALAEILFGERSPEGKLPISYERSWKENPVHDNYYASSAPVGQTPHVKYAEGLFVGYRYYTSQGKQPLFPFGFGLSYTQFSFGNLSVSPGATTAQGPVTVSFDVTNTGQRTGAEVAQLYVGDPSAKITRPVKELKGFQKVRLDPGQTQHVMLMLDRRALAYWDESRHDWRVDPGKFQVFVGDSSENTPITASFTVQQ